MPWTDQPGPSPQRSERELLGVVRTRAVEIRRRRRALVSAGVGMIVAVALAGTVLAQAGDDRPSELHVIGPVSTSTPALGATTLLPSTLVPPVPTSTTRPPAPTTTRTTLRPTTTARPTTTVRPTTTSTRPAPLPQCNAADVVVTATPDRSTVPVGGTFQVLVAALNKGTRACAPSDPKLEYRTTAGALLTMMQVSDAFTMGIEGQPGPSWDPGETLSITMGGIPIPCTDSGTPCPAGTYTVTAVFGPFRSPATPVTVT